MQPVQECLCRVVLFQGFVVTSVLDAYHISFVFKADHRKKHKAGFFGDDIMHFQLR